MNDWLTYKGSGSSRSYIGETLAHYGVKGMKWDPSKLFGKPDLSGKQITDQVNATERYISALTDQYNKYGEEYGEANMQYKENDTIFIPKQQEQISEANNKLKELETKYSNLSKTSPLEATRRYSRSIYDQKKRIQELEDGLEKLKKVQMDCKRKMEICSVKANDVQKKIAEAEKERASIVHRR